MIDIEPKPAKTRGLSTRGRWAMERFDLGRVFSRLFSIIFKTIVPVTPVLAILYTVVGVLVYLLFRDLFGALVDAIRLGASDPTATEAVMAGFVTDNVGKVLLIAVVSLVVGAFVRGGAQDSALRAGRGEEVTTAGVVSAGMANLGPMLVFGLIYGVISNVLNYGAPFVLGLAGMAGFGQFVAFVILMILMGFFCCAAPAIVNEPGINGLSAFRRSLDLTRGNVPMIILTIILIGLIMVIGLFVGIFILGMIGGLLAVINPWVALIMIVPGVFFLSAIVMMMEGAMAALYQELKGINEGDDANLSGIFS